MNNGAEVFEVDGFDSEDGTPMGACRVVLEKDYAAVVAERDRMREALETMLASAHPTPTLHPTMTAAWEKARAALSEAPK